MIRENRSTGVSATRPEKFSRSLISTVISRVSAPIFSGSAPSTIRLITDGDR